MVHSRVWDKDGEQKSKKQKRKNKLKKLENDKGDVAPEWMLPARGSTSSEGTNPETLTIKCKKSENMRHWSVNKLKLSGSKRKRQYRKKKMGPSGRVLRIFTIFELLVSNPRHSCGCLISHATITSRNKHWYLWNK